MYALGIALLGTVGACENPLKDFNLLVSTEVIKNSATLEVLDFDGNAVNATIKLASGDIADVYNLEGKKEFKLAGNLVSFGLDPKRVPTSSAPVTFQVEISAAGYTTQIVPVTITNINTGIQAVRLVKPSSLPEGATSVDKVANLNNDGSLATATVVHVEDAKNDIDVTVTIPAGVKFMDAAGNVLTGNAVSIRVIGFDAESASGLTLFPGGRLQATGVQLNGGATGVGTFDPAATTNVVMNVNGVEVRQFSQPISIAMGLDPAFKFDDGSAVQAGKSLELYSYANADGFWKYESSPAITGSDVAGYDVVFTTSHLTTFCNGQFIKSCAPISEINISADWLGQGLTYPIVVDAVRHGAVIASRQFSVSQTSNVLGFDYLPASNVTYVFRNLTTGVEIARVAQANCGSQTHVTLPNPNPVIEAKVTLQLYVRCPDKTDPITLLPTFQLYYRVSGSGSTFNYLGEVTNGFLQTTLLKSNGTKYDFQAVYKNRVKTVNNKTLNADNSGTVGIKPGDIIGEKAGANNLAILTEECGK